jgi:hypothetical protein
MAINLTSVVMQLLTPEAIAQISSFLGLDRSATQKAAGGAIPALLAGLSDLVSTPAGASQFAKVLSQQKSGSVTDILRNASPQGLVDTGSNMLTGLFGEGTMGALAQAVGSFAGTGTGGAKSLLGVLGPIVLGTLGQHQRDMGLDANGLTSLLRSQKDQILRAVPLGLTDQLSAAGLIDRAEAGARSGMEAASVGASRIAGATSAAGQTAYNSASRAATQWPYWLAGLVILGGLAWYASERPDTQVAEHPTTMQPATGTVGMAPADLTVDGVNLANKFSSSVDALKAALPGITDADTAQAAVPKINEVTSQLNDISTLATKLSPTARSALAKQVAAATSSIDQMCDKVTAIPGIGAVAKLAIDDLRGKLDALSRT